MVREAWDMHLHVSDLCVHNGHNVILRPTPVVRGELARS